MAIDDAGVQAKIDDVRAAEFGMLSLDERDPAAFEEMRRGVMKLADGAVATLEIIRSFLVERDIVLGRLKGMSANRELRERTAVHRANARQRHEPGTGVLT